MTPEDCPDRLSTVLDVDLPPDAAAHARDRLAAALHRTVTTKEPP